MAAPSYFLDALRELPQPFTARDAARHVGKLMPSTVAVYLSQLVSDGLLEKAGRGLYAMPLPLKNRRVFLSTGDLHDSEQWRRSEAREPGFPIPSRIQVLGAVLRGQLMPGVLAQTTIWGSDNFEPFSRDHIRRPFVVVEMPRRAFEAALGALSKFQPVPIPSRSVLPRALSYSMSRGGSAEEVFVVPGAGHLGSHLTFEGYRVLTAEGLLRHALRYEELFPYAMEIAHHPAFNPNRALSMGSRVVSFLTLLAVREKRKDILHALVRSFPFLERLL